MESNNIAIEDIKKIFRDMFKQHEETITKKYEEMLRDHEKNIMQLISGKTTLANQRFSNPSKEIADLKKFLEFTEVENKQKFSKLKKRTHNGRKSTQT